MRGRRQKLQVSTFPFLAVLLCAMGSLILVLLVMDRKAHKAAQARAQREAARLVEESAQSESARRAESEQLKKQALKEWEQKRDALHEKLTKEQIDLQVQMRKVREELQGIAARLHYEQDTTTQLRRKTQDERSRLQAEEQLLRTLRSNAKLTENQSKESSQALRRMTLDVLQIEQVLKDLKASRQREHKTFSVVPYHGRRGENRRPLYVECTADGVIFHPERKALSIVSLIPRSDDSNSEVRAEVEQRIAQQRQKLAALPSNVDKTPYLLLLLRPSGVSTYHLLQRALRGLPLDFGYEFIDEDWVLDFPADDELPSTQPWMMATKTPSRPALTPRVAASPPPRTSPRPMGGLPAGNSMTLPNTGFRGFRASEAAGNGSWAKGDGNPSGPAASGTGGGPGGAGPGMPGGGGSVSGSQALFGIPGGEAPSGASPPGMVAAAKQSFASVRSQAELGNEGVGGIGGVGTGGVGTGGVGTGGAGRLGTASNSSGIGTGFSRGSGRGHPSAMPPRFPSDEGEIGYTGECVASGGGYRGTGGLFPLRGSNSGAGPGSSVSMGGASAGPGGDSPGLGPPRALGSGPGQGYAVGGGATSAIAGNGSIGNGNGMPGAGVPGNGWVGGGTGVPGNGWVGGGTGVPGNGWVGGGTGVPGISGGTPGMGTSTDGQSVIARANNGPYATGSGFNGGGGGPGTGGTGMPGAVGQGGSSPGTSINYGPNIGGQGSGGPSSGTQMNVGGSPGGQALVGTPMPGALGSGGASAAGAPINNGAYAGTQGAGGSSSGSDQASNVAGGATNAGGGCGAWCARKQWIAQRSTNQ